MDEQGSRVPSQEASLFGKLPTVLDYVRVNHSYAAAIAFDEWLSRAVQELALANASWSASTYRFLFAAPGVDHALIGVVARSRDRAGRKFPLSIFTPLPRGALCGGFAAVARAAEPFFSAATELLAASDHLTRDTAAAQLQTLPLPLPQELRAHAEAQRAALEVRSVASFASALFGGDLPRSDEAWARARAVLRSAQEAAAERASVLECPIRSRDDVEAWLALCERTLGGRAALPTLFWTLEGEPGRLLVSLGAPAPTLSLWLAERKRKSERLSVIEAAPPAAAEDAMKAPDDAPPGQAEAAPTSIWSKLCETSAPL